MPPLGGAQPASCGGCRWGDLLEDEEELPAPTTSGPDARGVVTKVGAAPGRGAGAALVLRGQC